MPAAQTDGTHCRCACSEPTHTQTLSSLSWDSSWRHRDSGNGPSSQLPAHTLTGFGAVAWSLANCRRNSGLPRPWMRRRVVFCALRAGNGGSLHLPSVEYGEGSPDKELCMDDGHAHHRVQLLQQLEAVGVL